MSNLFAIKALMLMLIINTFGCRSINNKECADNRVEHGIVYYQEGRFAAWPANHGIWQWGVEILVGFVEASHKERGSHTYEINTARDKYARSKDGGLTWVIEDAYSNGQKGWRFNHQISDDKTETPAGLMESIDFTHPDLALTFLRTTNVTGPSHLYYSYDRGNFWKGPYLIPDLDTEGVATRTDYIINGKDELISFFTVAKSDGHEGRVACVKTRDGGINWERVSWVGPEPERFDIMPSSIRLSGSELLAVIRTRKVNGQNLLTSYLSPDDGKTWESLNNPANDTGSGGSPPALLKMDNGILALAYSFRSQFGSRLNLRFSIDNGRSWRDEIVLRGSDGANWDVGYPRMVQRQDGKLLIIYYWNHAGCPERTPYRYIAYTLVDPAGYGI